MEWVETTAKSVDEAKDQALDQLGVAADEAEFEVVEEPKSGLFGRVRGEARVRARVKPAAVRPKQDRRQRSGRNGKKGAKKQGGGERQSRSNDQSAQKPAPATNGQSDDASNGQRSKRSRSSGQNKEKAAMEQDSTTPAVSPQEVGDAAVAFMSGLVGAFGVEDAQTDLTVDGTDLDVKVSGGELGLLVGPGGRTLTAVQDLARVSSQRRLGDHDTRLRIDVGGYREKRKAALEQFAATVAAQVIDTGEAKALEPMASADRKAVHDAVIEIDGVTSHSEGDDPRRRVVITPA